MIRSDAASHGPFHFVSWPQVDERQEPAIGHAPGQSGPALQPGDPGTERRRPTPSGRCGTRSSRAAEDAPPATAGTPPKTRPAAAAETPKPARGQEVTFALSSPRTGSLISSDDTASAGSIRGDPPDVMGPHVGAPRKKLHGLLLKHCKAEVARQLISDISGGKSEGGAGGGSLIGDVASNLMGGGGGILGALWAVAEAATGVGSQLSKPRGPSRLWPTRDSMPGGAGPAGRCEADRTTPQSDRS